MGAKFWKRKSLAPATSNGTAELKKDGGEDVVATEEKRGTLERLLKSFKKTKNPSRANLKELAKKQSTEKLGNGHASGGVGRFALKKKPSSSPVPPPPATPPTAKPQPKTHLTENEVEQLFSGAPQFAFIEKDGEDHSSVGFPWDRSFQVRDQSDCPPLSHSSYSLATLRKHLVTPSTTADAKKKSAEFDLEVVEVPSMLSSQGLERGTSGFDFFLQLAQSDNLRTADAEDTEGDAYFEGIRNRDLFWDNPEKLGLRKHNLEAIVTRLSELCELHYKYSNAEQGKPKTILDEHASTELYTNLFGHLLNPPRFDSSINDPTGLKIQIQTLIRILGLRGIWKDFSLVEWRIRIGQLLWPATVQPGPETNKDEEKETQQERLALLLQIALAAELFMRLDAIAAMDVDKVTTDLNLTTEDVKKFRELKTRKISWDLVLAQRFLDNVVVQYVQPQQPSEQEQPQTGGRLWGLLSAPEPAKPAAEPEADIVILPRYQKRQLDGLVHFARGIGWPNVETFEQQMTELLQIGQAGGAASPQLQSIYGTPLATPRQGMSPRNSYFSPSAMNDRNTRPGMDRTATTLSVHLFASAPTVGMGVPSQLTIGGWLTRSYLTSLILPGETMAHFLISTLLENDLQAIGELNDNANLYGGFVFQKGSWWSKACIVGRVMACLPTARESMGWVGLGILPKGVEAGLWVEVVAEDGDKDKVKKIKDGATLLNGNKADATKAAELTLPADRLAAGSVAVNFKDLVLKERPSTDDVVDKTGEELMELPADDFATYDAFVHFSLPASGTAAARDIKLHLKHDIHFVTSFPCTPPPPSKLALLSAGTDPLAGFVTSDSEESSGATPTPIAGQAVGGHPLHTDVKYKIIDVVEMLDLVVPSSTSGTAEGETKKENQAAAQEVTVIDARASSTHELLARSWCAERGLNALISRVGRTCLACSIREARGLGVGVVVRIDKEEDVGRLLGELGQDGDGAVDGTDADGLAALGEGTAERPLPGKRQSSWGRLHGSALDF